MLPFLLYFIYYSLIYESLYNEALFHGCQEPPRSSICLYTFSPKIFPFFCSTFIHLLLLFWATALRTQPICSIHEPESTLTDDSFQLATHFLLGKQNTHAEGKYVLSWFFSSLLNDKTFQGMRGQKTDNKKQPKTVYYVIPSIVTIIVVLFRLYISAALHF